MPIDTSLLTRTDKLTHKDIPQFDDDEWLKIYGMRDAIHDFHIQTKSQRRKVLTEEEAATEEDSYREGREIAADEEDPDVTAIEERDSAAATSEMETHNGEFWWGVFDYMVPSFHIWDVQQGKRPRGWKEGDAEPEPLRRLMDHKDPKDRRKVFMILGNQLLPFLSERAGGTPVSDNKKPDGSQVTFPGGRTVGDTSDKEAVPSA